MKTFFKIVAAVIVAKVVLNVVANLASASAASASRDALAGLDPESFFPRVRLRDEESA